MMKRRSFLKLCAGVIAAPLSFLEAAAATPSPNIPLIITRQLKANWTEELERDISPLYLLGKI
jgi:hypothetical protein